MDEWKTVFGQSFCFGANPYQNTKEVFGGENTKEET